MISIETVTELTKCKALLSALEARAALTDDPNLASCVQMVFGALGTISRSTSNSVAALRVGQTVSLVRTATNHETDPLKVTAWREVLPVVERINNAVNNEMMEYRQENRSWKGR